MTQKLSLLRRYTDIPTVLHLLHERKLTLLDPALWDDTNDSYYLGLYKQKGDFGSVLALCFTQANETYHHWRIFAPGASGICVCFERTKLLDAVDTRKGLACRDMQYKTLSSIKGSRLKAKDLPFMKRIAFQDEAEFRFVYESRTETLPSLGLPIALNCIDRIVVSPWMHQSHFQHIRTTLRSIPGCANLKVTRSTLISNDSWKSMGDSAA